MTRKAETSPEFKRAMAHLSRAQNLMLDAVCTFKGYNKTHPLRKEFRNAFRGMAAAHGGQRPTKSQLRDMRLIAAFERLRKEMREAGLKEPTKEQDSRWMDALLDWFNER